jgi:glyoxylase-like metal-dependent hydrolase (beta-lactamase superfamily II)
LEAGLAAAGRRIEDLERIVLTHQHIDHSGAAASVVERSGAELCGLDSLGDWLERYPASLEDEDSYASVILRAHGVKAPGAERGEHRGGQDFGDPAVLDRRLHDGDVVGRFRVLFRPGHSPFDTILHDEETGMVFGGDHLLHWPSTPILTPVGVGEPRNGRPRAFAQYLDSLRATDALEVSTILPGHGEPLHDHRATIAGRFERYARITEQTAAVMTSEPRTAAEIAAELKGGLSHRTAFFVLCEVLGHLDQLIDEGVVVEQLNGDGVSRFANG